MRFFTLAANALIGGAALALALPATQTDACCCCNGKEITCRTGIAASECICLAVICPPDAPVVWIDDKDHEEPKAPPAEPPADKTDEVEAREEDCCCCNIGKKEISCKKQPVSEGCYCPAVVCPKDAPVVWE
ncbi:hypothetical protein ACRE_001130 [Hapsidospora chrysogenum ATCC 11550]|uniref:Extracellular membrane protein CFEM domain-containing protein n=1 Tax=Hapsidospora chrysogenum (strain ATCC 11550 / CBS 779.69 / DSM 880 / IAM 14645 / JCM 23072 / IMI 49137) TaxID=857340 RepID=A0A086THX5_HAPC1|nr:hypothetical protein ACRE_001130 [Hapsidospora chrysogenum ATCC 11550]